MEYNSMGHDQNEIYFRNIYHFPLIFSIPYYCAMGIYVKIILKIHFKYFTKCVAKS